MTTPCIICGSPAKDPEVPRSGRDVVSRDCPRCGKFDLTGTADSILLSRMSQAPLRWAAISHIIRRMQAPNTAPPVIDRDQLISICESGRLPRPQQQANDFILYLGRSGDAAGDFTAFDPLFMQGYLGTADREKQRGLQYVLNHLKEEGLVEIPTHITNDSKMHYRLTFPGWALFEELMNSLIDSRLAFMAMGYSNPSVAKAVAECFIPAVEATGFLLRRLDQKPRGGLIDMHMRVDLRQARFIVADLTDENRGAYWEAGFAEGLGRPVFYTCEESKFDLTKTHFDTEHLHTIKWQLDRLPEAADALKSVIRNTLLSEAKQTD